MNESKIGKNKFQKNKSAKSAIACDSCAYFTYDEEYEEYVCDMDMDEDDYASVYGGHFKDCPFYRNGDEYLITRKQ